MLLSKSKIEQIIKVIKDRHNLFVVNALGTELLSDDILRELTEEYGDEAVHQVSDLITDGYYVGYLRNKDLGSVDDISHTQFTNLEKPFLNDLEKYSIEHSKEVVDNYVQKLSGNVRANFESLIRDYNKAYKDFLMTNTALPMATIAEQEGKSISQLVSAMRDLTGDFARDWERVARTETTNVINIGMADKIVKMNKDTSADKIYVFKRVVNDGALCPHCRRLHLMPDGVTPRIYTLEEALGNGSNIGRKANDWMFIIGAVHPHCRCFTRGDTKILTKLGWKKIKDIKIGEEVLTHKGRWRKVLNTLENWGEPYKQDLINCIQNKKVPQDIGKKELIDFIKRSRTTYGGKIYKVTIEVELGSIGRKVSKTLSVTPDHRFLTKEGWKETKELEIGEKLAQLQKKCEFEGCNSYFNVVVEKDEMRYCSNQSCISKRTAAKQWKTQKNNPEFMKAFRKKQADNNYERYEKYTEEQLIELTKNGRKKCRELGKNKQPTKPQLELFSIVKEIYPEAELEYFFEERYSFDIAIPSLKLDIEYDGSIWHSKEHDEKRDAFTKSKGWEVIRYVDKIPTKDEIKNDISRIYANHNSLYRNEFVANIVDIKISNNSENTSNIGVVELYDLEVEEDHSFVSWGIISHNCQLVQLPPGYWFNKNGQLEFVGTETAEEFIKKYL